MANGKNSLYDDIKRQVLTMELNPGQSLDAVSLGERYGLSRTPVREVIRSLAGEGFLNIGERRGALVAPMDHSTLRNFFLVATMVYAAVGRLAAHNYKPLQLEALQENQERFRRAIRSADPQGMAVENNRFHEIIGEMSASAYLIPCLVRLLIDLACIGHTFFFRLRNAQMERHLQLAAEHHDAFIDAFVRHDESAIAPAPAPEAMKAVDWLNRTGTG